MNTSDEEPQENLAIYRLVYEIEVALRELFIDALGGRFGARWWIQRLPRDVLSSCREGLAYERSTKWVSLVPLHPIYYADFGDLRKVIERDDNWREVFQSEFGRRDIIAATLSELEPIRNKVAHNRRATAADLEVAEAAHQKIALALGEGRFADLLKRCTTSDDLPQRIEALHEEASACFRACVDLEPISSLSAWDEAKEAWWFASEYLDGPLSAIAEYFSVVEAYQSRPRTRGTGHILERWVSDAGVEAKYHAAAAEFASLWRGSK